mmetsp:Transcript_29825/g.79650  ORF Transcript_29825/g.79650 Transcript_29825/m.79650 type:complete len:100 (-) Transcript_29825:36-335(-)
MTGPLPTTTTFPPGGTAPIDTASRRRAERPADVRGKNPKALPGKNPRAMASSTRAINLKIPLLAMALLSSMDEVCLQPQDPTAFSDIPKLRLALSLVRG